MKILYFAWIRERIGKDLETLALPEGVATAADLRAWLSERDEGYQAALGGGEDLKVAVNQTIVPWTHPVSEGDEVAFFPPMTGG